jgi:hypothetical protein
MHHAIRAVGILVGLAIVSCSNNASVQPVSTTDTLKTQPSTSDTNKDSVKISPPAKVFIDAVTSATLGPLYWVSYQVDTTVPDKDQIAYLFIKCCAESVSISDPSVSGGKHTIMPLFVGCLRPIVAIGLFITNSGDTVRDTASL